MLDCIRIIDDVPDTHGTRIPKDDLHAERQRKAVLEQARSQASACLDQAGEEASHMRLEGYRKGYADGLQRVCVDLAALLLEQQVLVRKLHQDLEAAAGRLLGDLLHRQALVDELIAQWLADREATTCDRLHLLLPDHLRDAEPGLPERIRQRWREEGGDACRVHVEWVPDERYLLRLGDQVLEFDPRCLQARLAPELLCRLEQLPEAARQLDERTRSMLRQFAEALASRDETHENHEDQEGEQDD